VKPRRALAALLAAFLLSWLLPGRLGMGVDLLLAVSVMVAAMMPLEHAVVPIAVVGLLDGCLSGAIFGSRALSLVLIAIAVAAVVRHMHPGTIWVRLALLVAAALAAQLLGGLLGLERHAAAPSWAAALRTSLVGLAAWVVLASTPPRREAW